MALKQKTISGFFWSFIENFATQGLTFVIGVVLANLLKPEQFGLIGMITVVIAISKTFIDSGFSQALIRKKDCTDTDYSTVFYFNFTVGLLFAALVYFTAPLISSFYGEPALVDLLKVLSVVVVLDALTIIQRTLLIKRIDFKLQTKISVVANIVAGVVAIIMALRGFGVWSLVVRQLILHAVETLLFWLGNRWVPRLEFSKTSFRELFGFGSNLLLSGLLNTVFQEANKIVIGKYFATAQLGFYTKADQFKRLPSQNLNGIIQRVTFPVLSEMKDEPEKLRRNYIKVIRATMFLTFAAMLGLAAIAKPLILTLLGENWSQSIIYLQLLCFAAMLIPLHSLNLNMLKVQGESGKFLKLAFIKKLIAVPFLIIGVILGIKWLIIGMIARQFIAYFLNSAYSGKLIGYSSFEQLRDILPSFLLAAAMAVIVFFSGNFLTFIPLINLIIQIFAGVVLVVVFSEILKFKDYHYLKEIVMTQLNRRNQKG